MTACTLHKSQRASSSLSRLKKKVTLSTLWRREEFQRICSKEDLAEKAQDIEVTVPVKKSQEARYNLDPESFFVNCFWGRRLDGVAVNEALQIVYVLDSDDLKGRQTGTRGS